MGLVWLSVLPVDAVLGTKVDVLLAHVLSALVIAQTAHLHTQLRLSKDMEALEGRKSVRLVFERYYHPEPTQIVDERHPVAVSLPRTHRNRPMQV